MMLVIIKMMMMMINDYKLKYWFHDGFATSEQLSELTNLTSATKLWCTAPSAKRLPSTSLTINAHCELSANIELYLSHKTPDVIYDLLEGHQAKFWLLSQSLQLLGKDVHLLLEYWTCNRQLFLEGEQFQSHTQSRWGNTSGLAALQTWWGRGCL